MEFNTSLILIILGIYLAFMVYLGFYFKDRNSSFDDFITGSSGGIPWFILAMTMLATLANAQQTLGIAGTSYALGLSPMIWYFILVNIFIFPLLIRLGSRYRQLNFDTIVDLGEARYPKSGRMTLLLSAWQVGWAIVCVAICFFGGALVIETVFGVNIWVAIAITGIVTVFYCVLGGLKGVVFTDTIQWMIILFGTATLVPAIFAKYGSFSTFFSALLGNNGYTAAANAAIWPGFTDLFSLPSFAGVTAMVLVAMGLAGSLWIPIDLSFMQRMLAAKTPKDGRKAGLGFLVVVTLWACIMVVMGCYGAQLFPGLKSTDTAILMVANDVMPGLGMAIFVSAIAAAVMSTVSAYLNAAAAILTKNIYKRFINKNATDGQMLKFCRIMIVLVAIAALCFAPMVRNNGVFGTSITIQMVLCASVSPMILLSTYWKRITERAAFWGSLISGVVTLAIVISAGGGNAVFYGAGFMGIPAIFIGLAVGFIIYIGISLITPYDESKIGPEFLAIFNNKSAYEKTKPTDLIVIGSAVILLLIAIFFKSKSLGVASWPPLSGIGGTLVDIFIWAIAIGVTAVSIYILVRTIKWVRDLKKFDNKEDKDKVA